MNFLTLQGSLGTVLVLGLMVLGCGSTPSVPQAVQADASALDGGTLPREDASAASDSDVDGGAAAIDMRLPVARDRFPSRVALFTEGSCAGFGADRMPGIVLGPPEGGGLDRGGLDVVSLGTGGSIVLSFETNPIVDGAGADFIVFENAFNQGGDAMNPFANPAEVSVSDDGLSWTAFPCTAKTFPYGSCAGWHPVLSASSNTIACTDVMRAGGDAFDLAMIGVSHAKFVRIVDQGAQACSAASMVNTNGFDLDAVVSVHAEREAP
jgi:hypothetical protein